jgi:hypothetical protein
MMLLQRILVMIITDRGRPRTHTMLSLKNQKRKNSAKPQKVKAKKVKKEKKAKRARKRRRRKLRRRKRRKKRRKARKAKKAKNLRKETRQPHLMNQSAFLFLLLPTLPMAMPRKKKVKPRQLQPNY